MTYTEYKKTHKYVFVHGERKINNWACNEKDELFETAFYIGGFKGDITLYEAILEEKPQIDFDFLQEHLVGSYTYGYYLRNGEKNITKNQIALDMINSIVANQIVQFDSYERGKEIKLTNEEYEEYF